MVESRSIVLKYQEKLDWKKKKNLASTSTDCCCYYWRLIIIEKKNNYRQIRFFDDTW